MKEKKKIQKKMKNRILLNSFKYKLQNKFNLKLMFLFEQKVKI